MVFLNNSQNKQKNNCVESLFHKVAGVWEIFKSTFFIEHLRATATVLSSCRTYMFLFLLLLFLFIFIISILCTYFYTKCYIAEICKYYISVFKSCSKKLKIPPKDCRLPFISAICLLRVFIRLKAICLLCVFIRLKRLNYIKSQYILYKR